MANKTIKKKNNKKKLNKKVEEGRKDELFSFDNEIIIGVTKKEDINEQVNKNKKSKKNNKSVQKNISKNVSNKKSSINDKKKIKNNNKIKKVELKDKKVITQKEEKALKKRKTTIHVIKYGMILVLFIVLVICTMFSPLFNIKTIEVEGNEKISKNEIISLSQIEKEENTFNVNTEKVSKKIKENAYIGEVKIKRNLPSTIIIEVEERKAIYLLEYAGSYVYVDKNGYILEISQEKLQLPILQGQSTATSEYEAGNRLEKEDLQKLLLISKVMEAAKANEIEALITRIDIENIENIKLIFETEEKIAYIGNINNLVTKIPTVKLILEKEKGKPGEIFVNLDLNKENAIFRERV